MRGFRLIGFSVTVVGSWVGIASAQVTTTVEGRTVPYIPMVMPPEANGPSRPNPKSSPRTEPTASTAKTNPCSTFLRTDPDILRTVNGYAQGSARNPRMNGRETADFVLATIEREIASTTPAVVNRNPSLFYASFKGIDRTTIANCWPTLNAVIVEKERRDAIEGEAQKQRQLAQEQRERQAQGAKVEQAQRQAANDAQPSNRLLRAYRFYILVKRCSDSRKGYAAVYINDEQMRDAKGRAAAIEGIVKAADRTIDTDAIWKSANSELADSVEANWIAAPQWDNDAYSYCRTAYSKLIDEHASVSPDAKNIKKDF